MLNQKYLPNSTPTQYVTFRETSTLAKGMKNQTLSSGFCPLHPEGSRSGYSTAVLTNNSGNVLSQEEALLLCQTDHNASLLSLDHPLAFEHLYVGTNTENLRNWLDFTYGDNDTYQCNWSDECLKEVRRLYWPNGRPFIQMDLASELVTSNPSKPKFYFSQSRKIIQTISSMTGNAICQKECFSSKLKIKFEALIPT